MAVLFQPLSYPVDAPCALKPRDRASASTTYSGFSALSDLDTAASATDCSQETSFSDTRVMTVLDLPLVLEMSDDESDADSTFSLADDALALEHDEIAKPVTNLAIDGETRAGVEPGRVFAMRDLPLMDFDDDLSSDEGDEDFFEEDFDSDADDELE